MVNEQKALSVILNIHCRHGLHSFFSSFPMSVFRNLEEEANKFYDMANKSFNTALLTRIDAQHFLSPYIDSEFDHNRHFRGPPRGFGEQRKNA